jgi:hypothetical protein
LQALDPQGAVEADLLTDPSFHILNERQTLYFSRGFFAVQHQKTRFAADMKSLQPEGGNMANDESGR